MLWDLVTPESGAATRHYNIRYSISLCIAVCHVTPYQRYGIVCHGMLNNIVRYSMLHRVTSSHLIVYDIWHNYHIKTGIQNCSGFHLRAERLEMVYLYNRCGISREQTIYIYIYIEREREMYILA